jgi:hypothetical protein
VILTTWYFVKPQPTNKSGLTQEDQQKIDSLAQEISILEYRQLEKDSLIAIYQIEIDSLDAQVVVVNNKITKIKEDYEEEISNLKRYTVTELNEFFTTRYQ